MTPAKKKSRTSLPLGSTKLTTSKRDPVQGKPTTSKKTAPKKGKKGGRKITRKTTKKDSKKTTRKKTISTKAISAAEAETVKDPSPKKKETKKAQPTVSSIRIRLSAFDHVVLDEATVKIIETAERSGAIIHGPVPLPTKIRKFTVNRATFIHKDARDQFEMRTHRRLIDLTETTFKTIESLQNLSLPSGVDIEIKMG